MFPTNKLRYNSTQTSQTLQQQGYLIKVRSRHGLNRNVVKRYSSLRKLHHTLKERFPTRQIPPFPPKCWFSNTSTTFLKQRRFDLEHYLQQLATNVGIMRLHEVIEFWETNDVNSEQHQVVIFGEIPEDDDDDDDEENEKSTNISTSRNDKVI